MSRPGSSSLPSQTEAEKQDSRRAYLNMVTYTMDEESVPGTTKCVFTLPDRCPRHEVGTAVHTRRCRWELSMGEAENTLECNFDNGGSDGSIVADAIALEIQRRLPDPIADHSGPWFTGN
jgi:hypothetical protein